MRTVVAFFAALIAATPALAKTYCGGGDVLEHAALAQVWRKPLDGTYVSACTMFVANGCVYPDTRRGPRTILKFHSAIPTVFENGRYVIPAHEVPGLHHNGNHVMLRHYPDRLKKYILDNGCFETLAYKKQCILTGSRLIALGVRKCGG